MNRPVISVVVPAYNEEMNVKPLYDRLLDVLTQISASFEIIFIDDGSRDDTVAEVLKIRALDERVKLVSFSRNFGHEMANTAGFRTASGDAVVIIDADLQDPPELILDMFEKYRAGFDVVYAKRKTRKKESFIKKSTSKMFYRVLKFMSDTEIPLDTGDFRLLSRRAVDEINRFSEKNRFFRGLTHWIGFKVTYVYFDRDERYAGETKYSYIKLMKLAIDAILSFSYKPLKLFSLFGFLSAGFGFLLMLYWMIKKIIFGNPTNGWTSTVTIMLFFFGILMMQVSVVGEYIARIYEEVRARPLYIVGRTEGVAPEIVSDKNEVKQYGADYEA
ncbi:glycosyltransferase family 2 protein [Fusibacter ferrireducens]|uniref:Glycosyltransferase family 2 protein n=1 Tax=Fusibacter ferrireducens TaxID=2785058 RepID=A0ABR9ZVT4_9FIRM|nr:glycosyltransferase family 2 protein [Fusibacter ferrireducens]MBF4694573.1 glycosyltransferase family 2 protein [Fusibacter ferrireducens]